MRGDKKTDYQVENYYIFEINNINHYSVILVVKKKLIDDYVIIL